MTQRVVVVTGASSGIGKEAAKTLAAEGWRVLGVGRNPARCASAETEIRAVSQRADAEMLVADLSRMAEVRRVAREIADRVEYIDVLLNNAGGMTTHRVVTSEGLEENFAGNHLGPFLLTNCLLPLLRAAAAKAPKGNTRIINVSSTAGEMIPTLNWDDLQLAQNFDAGLSYSQGKLANMLFTRGLAKRLAADNIVVHALHPGTVASNFSSHAEERIQAYMRTLDTTTPAEAAKALVWLATGDEPGRSTGGYYHQFQPASPNPLADDETAVERLWTESEKLIEAAS